MNDFTYEQLEIGKNVSFSAIITQDMMDAFYSISGDCNPMHRDDGYAQKRGFDKRICYGMLTASFYSTLAGVHLPGKRCLLQGVHADFSAPVYVGDKLEVNGKVVEKMDAYKRVTIKALIKRDGKTVSRATIYAGVTAD